MRTATPLRKALWTIPLAFLGAGPLVALAQEKPPSTVEERDLGDGFREVSVNGGPGAIIDDTTGLILKEIGGRPAVVDQEAGAILFLDDDGEASIKFYGGKKGGASEGQALDPKKLERMKSYMTRVQNYNKGLKNGREKRKKGLKGKPTKPKESLLERTLKLLGVDGEVADAIRPLLASVLNKQDQIRRSSARLPNGKSSKKPTRTGDLPAPIQAFLSAFRASLKNPADTAESPLAKALLGYRMARAQQQGELTKLREKLREVLSVVQEAKLTAIGVLD